MNMCLQLPFVVLYTLHNLSLTVPQHTRGPRSETAFNQAMLTLQSTTHEVIGFIQAQLITS